MFSATLTVKTVRMMSSVYKTPPYKNHIGKLWM